MASRERAIVNNLNERARFYGRPAEEMLTIYDVRALLDLFKHTCSKCGKHPATSPNHVKPLVNGGENVVTNLDLLCVECNKQEGDSGNDYRKGVLLTPEYAAQFYPEEQANKQDKRIVHDWDEIEFDYVSSLDTMRQLAERYKVSLRQLGQYASDNEWTEKRKAYSNRIATKVLAEIEAANVRDGFSAYKATFALLRRSFDDYIDAPSPDKLRAMDGLINKGLVLEGFETDRKALNVKDWRDAAGKDSTPIQDFASDAAETYFNGGDSGGDRESGAGWTD